MFGKALNQSGSKAAKQPQTSTKIAELNVWAHPQLVKPLPQLTGVAREEHARLKGTKVGVRTRPVTSRFAIE